MQWKLFGKPDRDGLHILYPHARAEYADGRERVFNKNDFVICALTEAQDVIDEAQEFWAAQVVGFYADRLKFGEERLRVELRWLYSSKDISERTKYQGRVESAKSTSDGEEMREVFYSDHFDFTANSIYCVVGKAFLHSTIQCVDELRGTISDSSDAFPGDQHLLCRSFYRFDPPTLRALHENELQFLVKHSGHEEMWSRFKSSTPHHKRKESSSRTNDSARAENIGAKKLKTSRAGHEHKVPNNS